ncbi:hypothetical protein [Candidatus Thiodiazotropha sp. CDECU1]|uniref:hypothetical protein n=1 Tax=Candidatus Thiodiazotropha sp. CDECU1 TaxID=3065865 RepID=UPI00293170D3|nr:hypothetical protein [Candidatus Thiodiazotropha sp. CDECU1]
MDTSDIIASSAVIIASIAVGVSIWQGYLQRKHFRLSVKPNISVHSDHTSEEEVIFTMRSNGLGPAIIKSFAIEVDGKQVPSQGDGLMKNALIGIGIDVIGDAKCKHFLPSIDDVYGPGEDLMLLDITYDPESRENIKEAISRLKFSINYSSIYQNDEHTFYGNC